MKPAAVIVQGDARRLPFRDGSFDVVVADPPYEVNEPTEQTLDLGDTLETTKVATAESGWP